MELHCTNFMKLKGLKKVSKIALHDGKFEVIHDIHKRPFMIFIRMSIISKAYYMHELVLEGL